MEDFRRVIGNATIGSNADKPLHEASTMRPKVVKMPMEAVFSFPATHNFDHGKAKKQLQALIEKWASDDDYVSLLNLISDVTSGPELSDEDYDELYKHGDIGVDIVVK